MAENSDISWTHNTFNPWRGCQKVSPGCLHCYADSLSKRNPKLLGEWGASGFRVIASEQMWKEPEKWNAQAAASGTRTRVFCASLADVFEEFTGEVRYHNASTAPGSDPQAYISVNDEMVPLNLSIIRRRLFALIDKTPHLDWLLVTKRPHNIRRMWPCPQDPHILEHCYHSLFRKNVWLLTSIENQEVADRRIPELAACRDLCPVLGLSCEPLLEPIRLPYKFETYIDWGIIGGESDRQNRFREMPYEPAIALAEQFIEKSVPVHIKQDSAREDGQQGRWPDHYWAMKQFPTPRGHA